MRICISSYHVMLYNFSPSDAVIRDQKVQSAGWGYKAEWKPYRGKLYTSCMTNHEGPVEYRYKPCRTNGVCLSSPSG